MTSETPSCLGPFSEDRGWIREEKPNPKRALDLVTLDKVHPIAEWTEAEE